MAELTQRCDCDGWICKLYYDLDKCGGFLFAEGFNSPQLMTQLTITS